MTTNQTRMTCDRLEELRDNMQQGPVNDVKFLNDLVFDLLEQVRDLAGQVALLTEIVENSPATPKPR